MVENNTELNAGVKALGEGAEKLVAGNQQVVDGVKKLQENLETSKKTMAASQDSLTQLSDGKTSLDNYATLIKTLKFLYVYKVEERTTVSRLSFLLLVYCYIGENVKNDKTKLF